MEKPRLQLGGEPVSWLPAQDSALLPPPPRLLQQVTCESDSQVGPTLPAGPSGHDSSDFPMTHTPRVLLLWSTSLETWQMDPHFLTSPKSLGRIPAPPLYGDSTLLQKSHQGLERESHSPKVTQQAGSTARVGARHPGTEPSPCLLPTRSLSPDLPLKGRKGAETHSEPYWEDLRDSPESTAATVAASTTEVPSRLPWAARAGFNRRTGVCIALPT